MLRRYQAPIQYFGDETNWNVEDVYLAADIEPILEENKLLKAENQRLKDSLDAAYKSGSIDAEGVIDGLKEELDELVTYLEWLYQSVEEMSISETDRGFVQRGIEKVLKKVNWKRGE